MKAVNKLGRSVCYIGPWGPIQHVNKWASETLSRSWPKLHKHPSRSSSSGDKLMDFCSSELSHYGRLSPNNGNAGVLQGYNLQRTVSTTIKVSQESINCIDAKEKEIHDILSKDMILHPNFLSEAEEKSLLDEVDKYMRRLRYEFDHWDNAIHGYRETEKKSWNDANAKILKRVSDLAFHSDVTPLAFVHVLDIANEGYIKPHVDAVRFCGDTIAGMCLLSSCVMRLALEKDSSKFGDIYLPRRCLYVMKDRARYDFTHEVLKEEESVFKGQIVPRDRRISVICRNEPRPEDRG